MNLKASKMIDFLRCYASEVQLKDFKGPRILLVTDGITAVLGQRQGLRVFEGLTHMHKDKEGTLLF